MTVHPLPALDGRDPLGFLCALGMLRLLNQNGHPNARLSFDPRARIAQLHSSHSCLDDVVTSLQEIVESIPAQGVLAGLPANFPPPGAAPDRIRLARKEFRAFADTLSTMPTDELAGLEIESWLSSLVTDLSIDDKGRTDVSLFTAQSGKQSMRTMLEKPLEFIRKKPKVINEALTGWRRYPTVTGEYLDNKVLYDAADAPDGRPAERGVPGATWLALMSFPLFLTTARGSEPITSGWQHIPRRRGKINQLIYPLWSHPVDQHGATALLTHPILRNLSPGDLPKAARAASIFLICHAERQRIPGRTFAGVLTPIRPQPSESHAARSRKTAPQKPTQTQKTSAWIT